MDLLTKIKGDRLAARKARQKERMAILTYVMGEIGRAETKVTCDQDVMKILKKVYKNLDKSLKLSYDDSLHTQLCILNEYIPQPVDREELRTIIEKVIIDNACDNIGQAMKALKVYSENTGLVYDQREASIQIKEVFNG